MANERTRLLSPVRPAAPSRPDDKGLPDTLGEVPWSTWLVLSGVWCGIFLAALDGTMVATLQTTIASQFKQNNLGSWLGTSYLLTVAAFQGLYGRVSDVVGRRWATFGATALFTFGTILCGVAGSMEEIIVGRAIAGIGGGGLTALSSIVCSDLVSLRQRGTFQGLANCLFGAGAALGGPIGGWLTERFGFRFAFLIQVPFAIYSLVIAYYKIDIPLANNGLTAGERLRQIDFVGAGVLVTGVASFVLAASIGGNLLEWSDPRVIGTLVLSAALIILFGVIEVKYASHPVMPPALVARRTPGLCAAVNFFGAASSFAFLYTAPIYFQAVRELSSSQAGLHLLPNAIGIPVGSLLVGYLLARNGKYYALTVISAAFFPYVAFSVATWGRHPAEWRTWFDPFFVGLGTAGSTTATLIALLGSVDRNEVAVATGLSYLARSIGQVSGVTLSSAILQDILKMELSKRIHDADLVERIRQDQSLVRTLPGALRDAAIDSYDVALRYAFIAIGCVGICGLVCSALIREHKIHSHQPAGAGEEAGDD
ncbi:hypothetical protein PYCC9005_004017 [Savitreella phatthalungensis]